MKVFITREIPEEVREKLIGHDITVTEWTEKRDLKPEELIQYCKSHDALLSVGPNKINRPFLGACPHLKVIALNSVGYDNVDVAAAKELAIPVSNTPDVLSKATADTAFMLMMMVARKALYWHKTIMDGEWGFFEPMKETGIELQGKTLGIFGLGRIGFELAKSAKGAFDMPIIYYNRHQNEEAESKLGAKLVSFDQLLAQSDVLSIHANLSKETMGLFNKKTFAKMKKEAIFINTARGGLHNEDDLRQALENGVIAGAGLDVTNPEPMVPNNPLLFMKNATVLPHIGSSTFETRMAMIQLATDNIIAGLKGEKLLTPIW
ncbi:Lactate dehydrogenase [bacterium A37T11]|nr:Lactate dehydrogenase [bacterium A37T11]